jgi:hypothetical protein
MLSYSFPLDRVHETEIRLRLPYECPASSSLEGSDPIRKSNTPILLQHQGNLVLDDEYSTTTKESSSS